MRDVHLPAFVRRLAVWRLTAAAENRLLGAARTLLGAGSDALSPAHPAWSIGMVPRRGDATIQPGRG